MRVRWCAATLRSIVASVWFRLRWLLIMPVMYALAFYCCIVEYLLDRYSLKTESVIEERWNNAELLIETPEHKHVAVLTGADGTIGTLVCQSLLEYGFDIITLGLHRPSIKLLYDWQRLRFIICDLFDPDQVAAAIRQVEKHYNYVDLVVFCHGTMLHPPVAKSGSIDPHYTINLLAPAFIFDKLRKLLESSPRSAPKVIICSSIVHHLGDLRSFQSNDAAYAFRHYVNGYQSYSDSKLYLSVYFRHVAKQLFGKSKIVFATVHPGVVPGKLYRYVFWLGRYATELVKPFARSPQTAANQVVDLAFSNSLTSGCMYEHGRERTFDEAYSEIEMQHLSDALHAELTTTYRPLRVRYQST